MAIRIFVTGPGPRLSNGERAVHVEKVSALYLKGWHHAAIGAALGCTPQQISYDVKQLHIRWQRAQHANIDQHKSRELAKVDQLERTYWEAWDQSRQPKQTSQSKRREGSRASTEASLRTEHRAGDATFLAGVQWCIERRCKILGLDEPLRIDYVAEVRRLAHDDGMDPEEAVREFENMLRERAWAL